MNNTNVYMFFHIFHVAIYNKKLFQTIVCGDDRELENGKPAPDIFLLCAARMDVNPAKSIAFEDSRNGIQAAKAAGMYVIALESPYATSEDLVEADLVVPDFMALF